jgi:hypothetical protein
LKADFIFIVQRRNKSTLARYGGQVAGLNIFDFAGMTKSDTHFLETSLK